MSCFHCFSREDEGDIRQFSIKEDNGVVKGHSFRGQSFASIVKSMSIRGGSSRRKYIEAEIQKFGKAKKSASVFTYQELSDATNNFNQNCLVGEGGFGMVYRGFLQSIDKVVAVKQLDRNGFQGSREFYSEVLMLSLAQHESLVNLIGYCADGNQRILVYEFMPNGSLENHLLDLSPGVEHLDWETRMRISLGAAKGLEYLHDFADPPVIYRDLKASNILLDNDFNPKLSDFGLAKLGPTGGKDHVSTRVMGTYGYCAPEYQLTGQLTKKSDVYSYGVVFLEIITGRRAIDTGRPSYEQKLVDWAEPLLKDREKFALLADPLLEGKYPKKGLYQALAVAAMCLQEDSDTRPSIGDVVTALEFLAKPKGDSLKNSSRYTGSSKGGEATRSSSRYTGSSKGGALRSSSRFGGSSKETSSKKYP